MANDLTKKLDEIATNLASSLKKGVVDFTTLEVTTLTGEVKSILTKTGNKKEIIKMSDIVNKIKTDTGGEIDLVAHTEIHFDHDTINFVKANMNDSDKILYQLHQASIRSANEGRNGFLGLLQKIIV